MTLTAICAKVSLPAFSVKHPEAFQVSASLPIPQPSTLAGALTYCLGTWEKIGLKAKTKTENLLLVARAKLLGKVTVPTPIMLRRFRVLDKGLEKGKTKGLKERPFEKACKALSQNDFMVFRKIVEGELTDAFYREYLTTTSLNCVWIAKEPLNYEILYLLQRLGDTESLVTVTEAWSCECREVSLENPSTEYPLSLDPNILKALEGSYMTVKMHDEKRSKLKIYYLPCSKEVSTTADGVKYFTYTPTKIEIKLEKPTKFFEVEGKIVAEATEGND
ncbi:type I-A CRISPR-associated protein Cas5 [Candidatus Bathyarchaeota archaeon]|nr:MAG: type I-A CRISPR-associated protein Cas5 [Candidatus Bathyarchaeota archaeon]